MKSTANRRTPRTPRPSLFAPLARLLSLAPLLAGLSSCATLQSDLNALDANGATAKALTPTVVVSDVQLRRSPAVKDLAAFYCPQAIDNPIVRMGCAATIGPPPPRAQLVFEFAVPVTIKNPNNIPIPALDVLLATTLFGGQDAQALGAICVSLCGSGDATCTGAPKPGSCTSSQNDIRRIEDFAARVPGLIAGLATGSVQNELRKSTIAAGGDVHLDLAFDMGIDQALHVVEKTAKQLAQALMSGQQPTLEIPVSAQGTVFVSLPAVGRVGVGFGPIQTVWKIL